MFHIEKNLPNQSVQLAPNQLQEDMNNSPRHLAKVLVIQADYCRIGKVLRALIDVTTPHVARDLESPTQNTFHTDRVQVIPCVNVIRRKIREMGGQYHATPLLLSSPLYIL